MTSFKKVSHTRFHSLTHLIHCRIQSICKLLQHYITTIIMAPSTHVPCTSTIYLWLCFIKPIVLKPSRVGISTIGTYPLYLHVFSYICVFLITALHASIYCIVCGSEDAMQYNTMYTILTFEYLKRMEPSVWWHEPRCIATSSDTAWL